MNLSYVPMKLYKILIILNADGSEDPQIKLEKKMKI